MFAESGVSSPDVGLRSRGIARFNPGTLSGDTGELRALFGSREIVHDGIGSMGDA